jgi:hypothetical protein
MSGEINFGGKTIKNCTLDEATVIGGGGGGSPKSVLSDVVGSTNYIGVAEAGSLTSDPAWTIYRTIYNSDGSVASTASSASNVEWDDRLTTSYS